MERINYNSMNSLIFLDKLNPNNSGIFFSILLHLVILLFAVGIPVLLVPCKTVFRVRVNNSIIDGVDELSKVYFIHSYRVENYDTNDEIASTNYFNHNILAMVKKNNITACQFHPEKSGEVGLKLLKNFFSLN